MKLWASMCIFSVGMMEQVTAELISGGYAADTPSTAVVEKASWPEQRVVRGTLADIAERVKASARRR